MRILAIHSGALTDTTKHSPIDEWRVGRPIRELKKHVNWTIDERPSLIPEIEKYKDLTEFSSEEMEKAFTDICSYDIVFASYQANPTMYTMLKVAEKRSGTQHIMDVDDDMFAINPDNPVWTKLTDEKIYFMQCMIRDNTWLSTTTEALKKVFTDRRTLPESSVFVNPNYIADVYTHPPVDNGDDIVIGYFGGSSHYKDVHNSGVLEAIQKIMHEHKNVRFKSVGMILDTYLPRGRTTVESGSKGGAWLTDVFPSLNFNIAIAPILDNPFNRHKSNIKWQESTRAGAVFACSDIGDYQLLPNRCVYKSANTAESWYLTLKEIITDHYRSAQRLIESKGELERNWRLEDHWQVYEKMFQTVYDSAHGKIKAKKELATSAT